MDFVEEIFDLLLLLEDVSENLVVLVILVYFLFFDLDFADLVLNH